MVHRALEQGIAWGWIATNPATRAIPPPARGARLHLPTAAEVNALVDAAHAVNRALPVFIRLAAVTGARRGELCALRWRHLDAERTTLHIAGTIGTTGRAVVERPTKTHAERRLTLDSVALTLTQLGALRPGDAAPADQRFIFTHDPHGAIPWHPNHVTRAFGRLAGQLGITGIRLHDLRHFAATSRLPNGVDVRTTAGRLGHARASTTVDSYAYYTLPGRPTRLGHPRHRPQPSPTDQPALGDAQPGVTASLPIRAEDSPADAAVVIRAGLMSRLTLTRRQPGWALSGWRSSRLRHGF